MCARGMCSIELWFEMLATLTMQESLEVCAGFIRDIKLDLVFNDQLLDNVSLILCVYTCYLF